MKHFSIGLMACALIVAPATTFAEPGQGGGQQKEHGADKGKAGDGVKKAKHEHKNKNGRQAL